MLFPFIFMISLSVSGEEQIFAYPPKIIPDSVTLQNYKNVLLLLPLKKYFANSMIIAVLTTVGQVFVSACAGYAFARLNFRF